MSTVSYKIYPGISIARLGNSPEDYFIGPEAPGIVADPGGGMYRDASGRIKRQGARFRIYEVDADQNIVREVTAADAEITWSTHLVNSKAAGANIPPTGPEGMRNAFIEDRNSLIIDAGEQQISGADQSGPALDGGKFLGKNVDLGALRTDSAGRLIVLGGHGESRWVLVENSLTNYANNDYWFDDVSDGPVNATVKISGVEHQAEPAWVVVASPGFAPGIDNVTTWYDEAVNVNSTAGANKCPSFTRDIYPILKRVVTMQWVHDKLRENHGNGEPQDFLAPDMLKQLASNSPADKYKRAGVFGALTKPGIEAEPDQPLVTGAMPNYKSGVDPAEPHSGARAALTQYQYDLMSLWSDGDFVADWTGSEPQPIPFDQIPPGEQPAALDRAALEACVGGPFFPGIETTYIMAESKTYEQAFRIDRNRPAGSMTQGMALPWQADYSGCGQFWWPAQRPFSVKRDGEFAPYTPTWWKPAVGPTNYDEMVRHWSQLGFILKEGDEYIEQQSTLSPHEFHE
jgi:hypothetical protein